MATFEDYKRRKSFWFWFMLTIGEAISEDARLSASKTTKLSDDFITSDFYEWMFADKGKEIKTMRNL